MGRSPLIPGDLNSTGLPISTFPPNKPPCEQQPLQEEPSLRDPPAVDFSRNRKARKRLADKENTSPTQKSDSKRMKLQRRTTHEGDHSITATEVSSQILPDGIDATPAGQGGDILKQYVDTFFGPVPGFALNVQTGAYDVNSVVGSFESPGRPWVQVNFTSTVNVPRPRQRGVQYTRNIGSRNLKDSDVDINIPEVYQHGVVVPSKIGERVTNILAWARRSFENMAPISLTGLGTR